MVSYVVYQIIKPLRFAVTFSLTPLVVGILREQGLLEPGTTSAEDASPTSTDQLDDPISWPSDLVKAKLLLISPTNRMLRSSSE